MLPVTYDNLHIVVILKLVPLLNILQRARQTNFRANNVWTACRMRKDNLPIFEIALMFDGLCGLAEECLLHVHTWFHLAYIQTLNLFKMWIYILYCIDC